MSREEALAMASSQPFFGRLAVGVEALEDQGGIGVARLRLRAPGVTRTVELAVGEDVEIDGYGRLSVAELIPSTADRRGAVRLVFDAQ